MHEHTLPRWSNLILGLWLVLSTSLFSWQSGPQMEDGWLVGAACGIAALASLLVPTVRFVNVALGLWLLVSSWMLPVLSPGMRWNNVISALLIMLVALLPSQKAPAFQH